MSYSLDTYQNEAMVFRKESADTQYALLGLSGEVGELHSLVAKAIRDGYVEDHGLVAKELGDILWFVAAIAADYNLSLSHIANANIMKLDSRQRRGVIEGSGDNR